MPNNQPRPGLFDIIQVSPLGELKKLITLKALPFDQCEKFCMDTKLRDLVIVDEIDLNQTDTEPSTFWCGPTIH